MFLVGLAADLNYINYIILDNLIWIAFNVIPSCTSIIFSNMGDQNQDISFLDDFPILTV